MEDAWEPQTSFIHNHILNENETNICSRKRRRRSPRLLLKKKKSLVLDWGFSNFGCRNDLSLRAELIGLWAPSELNTIEGSELCPNLAAGWLAKALDLWQ